jgi:hypothetical protein
MDPFELLMAQTPGQLAAIHPVSLAPSLFVAGGHIRRIDYHTMDSHLTQLLVDPKTTKPRLINGVVDGAREVMAQVVKQGGHRRRLVEILVFTMTSINAYPPGLLVDIQTDVNRLTCEIKFATLRNVHGKPPFGMFLAQT